MSEVSSVGIMWKSRSRLWQPKAVKRGGAAAARTAIHGQKVINVGFQARSHGGAQDHSHSNQEEPRTSFEWSHGSLAAGKVVGRRGNFLPHFLIAFSEALEADLGLAPVEKSV